MKYLKILLLTILATLCTSCTPALAYVLQGTVIHVYDGDTILLQETTNRETELSPLHRIRLASIDTPEKDQPYGAEAAKLLTTLIQNKTVLANVTNTDKYGRKIAYIQLANKDISSLMLINGAAWHYTYFDRKSGHYDLHHSLQQEAKLNKRGLWAAAKPIAPWEWRRKIK